MTTGQALSTNTFGVAKWVVSADATQGTHTTVAGAMASASSGDTIYIRDGTYTENVTLKAGVVLFGESYLESQVIGKLSMTAAGTAQIFNLLMQTNGDNIISITGANATAINIVDCFLNITNATGLSQTNGTLGSGIVVKDCQYTVANGFKFFDCATGAANGSIQMNGVFSTTPINTTASTQSNGMLLLQNCSLYDAISVTGGAATLFNTVIDMNLLNTTPITNNGGTVVSSGGTYRAGTASGITVTSGTVFSSGDVINSSNTDAVTGAGTINYRNMMFTGSSVLINTTTQVGGQVQGGVNGNAVAAGFIGQIISATIGSPGSALNASTVTNVTSITLTPGNWDISGVVGYHATTNATGNTGFGAWLSATTASQASLDNMSSVGIAGAGVTPLSAGSGSDIVITAGPSRVSIAANTTYYLNANWSQTIATGVISAYGMIRAIRVG